ncbi:MAG: DUF5655 domain-containing protein [Chitinophagaceae bacterium]|jgi:predicted transport protein
MQLYKNNQTTIAPLKEIPFKLEKEIQNFFEQNLFSITGLQFIKSEFTIKNYRIDTLAFDSEAKAFVIIEYKRNKHNSVFDQGITYLNLMLEYRSDFIIEYNECLGQSLKRDDIDWSQSRVVFVAPSFTDFQQNSTNFKDFSIDLMEIKQFENDIVMINPIKKSARAESIKPLTSLNTTLNKVAEVIKVYTEEDHLFNKSESIKELYERYKEAILNLIDDVNVAPKKLYISFEKSKRIIVDIVVQTQEIKLYINTQYSSFSDLQNLGVHMNDKTKWGRGYYQISIKDTSNLEYIMSLIKQAI